MDNGRVSRCLRLLPLLLLTVGGSCGDAPSAGESSSRNVPLQTVLRVCITPTDSLDDGRILGAVQEPVIATRDGTRETLIPEIESYGGLVFYINYGVSQSRIDEIADALAKSAPEVERVVQVKIRPFEDSGPPDDVCEDRATK